MLSSISTVLLVSLTTSTPLYIGRTELVNYDTAKKICQSSGGQLATFGNEAEWDQIRAIRLEYNTYLDDSIHVNTKNAYGLWIGLDDLKGEGLWEFIDGDMSYCSPSGSSVQDCDDIPEWAANQPDNTHTEGSHCAQVWASWNGRLDDDICTRAKGYICEYDTNAILKGILDLSSSTTAYIGFTEEVSYDNAKIRCAFFGGQLATFGNEVEWEQIRAVRAEYNTYLDDSMHVGTKNAYGLWIGFDDLKGEGLWEFIDGDVSYCAPQSSSIYDCDDIPEWAANRPDNTHTEGSHCAHVWGSWGGRLDDDICSKNKGYICEFDPSTFLTGDMSLLSSRRILSSLSSRLIFNEENKRF